MTHKTLKLWIGLIVFGLATSQTIMAADVPAARDTTKPSSNPQASDAEKNLKTADDFFSKNKTLPGVFTTKTGLQYKILKPSTEPGNPPGPEDFVSVNYKATLLNGKEFKHSEPKEPAYFEVNTLVPGLAEALQLMKPGAHWMIFIPPKLGYGEKGEGDKLGPNEGLIFDVELLAVTPSLDENRDGVVDEWEDLD